MPYRYAILTSCHLDVRRNKIKNQYNFGGVVSQLKIHTVLLNKYSNYRNFNIPAPCTKNPFENVVTAMHCSLQITCILSEFILLLAVRQKGGLQLLINCYERVDCFILSCKKTGIFFSFKGTV